MKCPKCGAEIPFYDLKPNCRHCGVNILYYTQEYELARDAKRTELERASARMVIARIKTVFIGSLSAIFRMVFLIAAVCALMIPFGSAVFQLPFYEETLSVGLIGMIRSASGGLLSVLPAYLQSTLFAKAALGAGAVMVFFAALTVVDVVILAIFLLGFLEPEKSAKGMRTLSVVACVIALAAQIAAFICGLRAVPNAPYAAFSAGFGGAVCFALHLILICINQKMLKKGIAPVYREYDPKRKALLAKVKSGEVDLDDLPLPVFESEEEYEMRIREFRHAMEEEAAADLAAKADAAAKAKEEAGAE